MKSFMISLPIQVIYNNKLNASSTPETPVLLSTCPCNYHNLSVYDQIQYSMVTKDYIDRHDGTIMMGSMSMVWHGEVRSPERKVIHWDYSDQEVCFNKGDEIGQFQLGSTVIVLTQKEVINSLMLNVGDSVLMGQSIASVHPMKT